MDTIAQITKKKSRLEAKAKKAAQAQVDSLKSQIAEKTNPQDFKSTGNGSETETTLKPNEFNQKYGTSYNDLQKGQEQFQVPDVPEGQPSLPSIESLFARTKLDDTQDSIVGQLLKAQTKQGEIGAFESNLEKSTGVIQQEAKLAELRGQMEIEAQKFQLIPEDVSIESQGRQRSEAAGSNIIQERQRRAQRDYLVLAATASAQQGKVDQSRTFINEAVKREMAKDENNLERLKLAYQLNSDLIGRQDSKVDKLFQMKISEMEKAYEEKKAEKEQIYATLLNATQNNAPKDLQEKIKNATTKEEAATLAGSFGLSPQQVLAQKAFEETVRNNKFTQGLALQQFNYQKTKDYAALIKEAEKQGKEEVANRLKAEQKQASTIQKVKDLGDILLMPGFENAVGASGLGRFSIDEGLTANKKEFIAAVDSVLSDLTLESLLQAKADGATFGALTQEELRILAASASRLNSPTARDKNGEFIMDDDVFLEEWQKIIDFAILDAQRAAINTATPEQTLDDMNVWDSISVQ